MCWLRAARVLQDRVDRAVRARADIERAGASGFELLAAIGLGESQDVDTGAEALLGVRALAQDDLDQCRGVAADLAGLPPQALRRPISIAPVARRHVLAHRRMLCGWRTSVHVRQRACRGGKTSIVRAVMRAQTFSRSNWCGAE